MRYRRLGKSGVRVSEVSLGSWLTFGGQISDKTAEALMKKAYDGGVNFFDNAEAYAGGKSEIVMGRILKKMKWARDTYLVSSKVFWGGRRPTQIGLCRKHVFEACHAALKRLQVDYLDLYFCHRPDPETPVEETVRAMHQLIEQGKVLYWGTSEWSAQQIMEAYAASRQYQLTPPTMEQPSYSMLNRRRVEREYGRLYTEIGLGTTVWSPLAGGKLTGKYNKSIPRDSRAVRLQDDWWTQGFKGEQILSLRRTLAGLGKIAAQAGLPMARLALAWCLKNPNVSTVIMGATKTSQVAENMKASEDQDKLTPDLMEAIQKIL